MLAFNSYGQLKGAVPQKDQPNHMGEERKVARTTPESLAKNNADKLKKSLKLDEKQYKELYAALLEYEKGVAANAKSKLSKKEQFNKLNQLNAILCCIKRFLFSLHIFAADQFFNNPSTRCRGA